MLQLDHSAGVPLRMQVETLLRDMLRQKEYQQGALLPDEIKLARQLGVSRGTVRAGISKLVFEGLLERKAGVGTRVSHRQTESAVRPWRSFTRQMASKGIKVENFHLDYRFVAPTKEAAQGLDISGEEVWRLERIRGWNGKPVLFSTSWFHPRLELNGTEDFTRPTHEILETVTGAKAHRAHEEFFAVTADAQKAKMLQIPRNTPLLLRRHTVYDTGSRPIEFAEIYYATSRFAVTFDLRHDDE